MYDILGYTFVTNFMIYSHIFSGLIYNMQGWIFWSSATQTAEHAKQLTARASVMLVGEDRTVQMVLI